MEHDDVVYLTSLSLSIFFGSLYKKINNKELKKWTGTIFGLILIFILSGYHIFHMILVCVVNILILLHDKQKCHLLSFAFSFTYLLFFRTIGYFGIPFASPYMNIIQMMFTLKIVGLALDIQTSHLNLQEYNDNLNEEKKAEIIYNEINPSVIDIIHYSFNYIGIITGPYFRYSTFRDLINLPFCKYADSWYYCLQKLKQLPIPGLIFLLVSHFWPTVYILTEEFIEKRSWLYRFWYLWSNFFLYRMRLYCAFILAECISIMAGLGAYPEITRPRKGYGPTQKFEKINEIAKDKSLLLTTKFNFETVNNVDLYEVEFCPTVRAAIKSWNTCIQYWMAVNVYKRFPYKQFRTFATFFVSAYWHGIYFGQHFCIWGLALYLLVEDLYVDLFLKNTTGNFYKFWEWIIWYMKMQTFGYFCIALQLLQYKSVMRYYNSVYHFWIIALVFMYLFGLIVKSRRRFLSSF